MKSIVLQRDLLLNLVRRNFVLQYKGSTLGVLWSLLLPLAQTLVMVFLFQRVVPLGIEAYPAFLLTGLLPWNWFSGAISSAGSIFLSNRDLARRPSFSSALLIVVNTITHLLTFLISLPILCGVLALYGLGLHWSWLFLPLLILIQGLLIIGLSMIIAIWNVFFRDVAHLVSVALMLLFYATPVFYRLKAVAERYQFLFSWNPMAVLIQSYRAVLFQGTKPEIGPLLYALAVSAALCGIGFGLYHRQMPTVVDLI